MQIAVIDYKMSNLFSINNALDSLGFKSVITSDPITILKSDGIVLPGVGSFPQAMKNLYSLELIEVIKEVILKGKPFMGICLGLQLLFSKSDEYEEFKGLGIINGSVESFSNYINSAPIPHVGWNSIYSRNFSKQNKSKILDIGLTENEYYYFVHSYFAKPVEKEKVLTLTNYGDYEFCSSILVDNIFACQFHPEKSGPKGLEVLKNFFIKEFK